MLTERIAINPALFSDEKSVTELIYALRRNIKWSEGRVLAELPKGWYAQAVRNINVSSNDLYKSAAKAALDPHRLQLIPVTVSPQVPEWDDYIDNRSAGVIANFFSSLSDHSRGCFLPSEVHEYLDQSGSRVGSYETSGSTTGEIIDRIDDFLFLNKRITLVNPDQWLFSGKSKPLFRELMTRWVRHGGGNCDVIRSRRRGKRSDDVERNWSTEIDQTNKLLKALNYKGKFRFMAVNDDHLLGGKVLHDRFLLGAMTGGVQMGYGLELTTPPKSNRWVIMKEASYLQEKAYFMSPDFPDEYEDEESERYIWKYSS